MIHNVKVYSGDLGILPEQRLHACPSLYASRSRQCSRLVHTSPRTVGPPPRYQTPLTGSEQGSHPSQDDPAAIELHLAIAEAEAGTETADGLETVAGMVEAAGLVAVVESTAVGVAVVQVAVAAV